MGHSGVEVQNPLDPTGKGMDMQKHIVGGGLRAIAKDQHAVKMAAARKGNAMLMASLEGAMTPERLEQARREVAYQEASAKVDEAREALRDAVGGSHSGLEQATGSNDMQVLADGDMFAVRWGFWGSEGGDGYTGPEGGWNESGFWPIEVLPLALGLHEARVARRATTGGLA